MCFMQFILLSSTLLCTNTLKKDPGRARQNSLATAGINFTKPEAQNKVNPVNPCKFGENKTQFLPGLVEGF